MANGSNSGVTFAKIRAGTAKFTADDTTKSAEIQLLQDTLYKAGYWAGDQTTGYYDKYTVAAVKGFQKINSIMSSPTGDTDKATLSKLEAWSGTLNTTRSTSPSILYIQRATQAARQNDTGAAITTIKNLLKNKGYTCTSTSIFDSGMYDNVVKFQRANGVAADGVVGQGTLALLQNTATKTSWLQGTTVKLTAGLLYQCGFKWLGLTSEYITFLNNALNSYGFTTKSKVCQFLTQYMAETEYGTRMVERKYLAGAPKTSTSASYYPYYGGGFFHLTFSDAYKQFSEAINNTTVYSPGEYATQYVAMKYPGASAGWFLTTYKASRFNKINWSTWSDDDICTEMSSIVFGDSSVASARKKLLKENISPILWK